MAPVLKGWRAYANLARGYAGYLRGASVLRARPVKLVFDPTNACHLGCPLCPTGRGLVDRRTGHAELALFQRLLDELGETLFMVDLFNWGDPLLNPRLEQFAAAARARGVVTTVCSNLSMKLTEARIERLLGSGIGELVISLDGASAATHERYRRGSDFALIVENMRRLVAARRRLGLRSPLLTWQFIVFRFNEHELGQAEAMAREIGVDRIAFRPPFLQGERYAMAPDEAAEVAGWAPSHPDFQAHVAPPPARRRCGWHYTAAAVNWDGTVTPCSTAFLRQDDLGTLGPRGEHGFMPVANNPAFQAARAAVAGRGAPEGLEEGGGERGGLCAHCPTPSIRDYHRHMYRRVAMLTGVALAEGVRRALAGLMPRRGGKGEA